jgi:hypothetical protein
MALGSAHAEKEFTAMNFDPSSDGIPVSQVGEISKESCPFPVSVDFGGQGKEGVEAIGLRSDSGLAKTSLEWSCEWNQHESVVATIKWWDQVRNNSVSPIVACASDIDFVLARARSLGIS